MENTYLLGYAVATLLTFALFSAVNIRYYKMSKSEFISKMKPLMWFSLFWPFALPSFTFHYWKPIISVLRGKSWEPDEIPTSALTQLTDEEMLAIIEMMENVEKKKLHEKKSTPSSNPKLN